jgi:hypothetical protein
MRIDLTREEQALFDSIRFDPASRDFHAVAAKNGEGAAALMRSLTSRRAIPPVRMRYFMDPDFFTGGRGRSRKQVLNDNGRSDSEILTHPHFLKYLHYFICGPQLPADVVATFRELAVAPLRDLEQMRQFVRARVRDRDLSDPGEEFFKVAVECELDLFEAKSLRSDAMNAARRRRR